VTLGFATSLVEELETNMTTDELILKAIEKCLEQASDPEQKRLFHWMKAAIQYPSIEAFFNEVQAAGLGRGKVSLSALDKAIEAVYSCKEYLADTMALSEEEKQEKLQLEKIRLDVVRTQIKDTLSFLGWLE
jgi:hypothetical protein